MGRERELAPVAVYQAIATVGGLQRGRTEAREMEPVGPVDDAVVDATLPFLNRHVRGLIEFQRFTGCRPGEACAIRRSEIDTGGTVWLYKPTHHKTAHRGKSRTIAIGPRAQKLLREFLTADREPYLFSPRRAIEEEKGGLNWKASAKRPPKERYNRTSYTRAIARACESAFPPPERLAQREEETRAEWWARLTEKEQAEVKAWRVAHGWAPNQLRHTFATRIRKEHGLEAVQVLLGHSKADITQIYAEKNEALAIGIAAKIG